MALVKTFDPERCIAIEDSLNRTKSNFDKHVEIGKLICEGIEERQKITERKQQ